MAGRLAGKTALITGAKRGIGRAIAQAFLAEGAQVWLSDIDGEGVAQTARELGADGRALCLDVRLEADWDAAFAAIATAGEACSVLVNNAGITGFEAGLVAHDPEHAALADWRAVLQTNLDGVFLGCRAAIRAMRPLGVPSAIINIGSRSGVVGIPGAAAYAAAKAAMRNHTKTVALYCAEQGLPIRCNVIQPAAILTPMWEPLLGDGPDRAARMAEFVAEALQRFGQPEEVAALAVLLASDECAYMTGAELNVDGGILAGSAARPGT